MLYVELKNQDLWKKQEAKWLLNSLGLKTPLSKVPLLGEIVNKVLLVGDKCMPEMHLKQPGFTYSACGSFTKNKERIEKFMNTGKINYIYKMILINLLSTWYCLWRF